MEHLTETIKIDRVMNHSTGSTTLVYGWPAFDMQDYDHANFVIEAFNLSPGTATGAVNIMQCQCYSATAATSTALTAITSATATFGATMTSALGITGAARLTVTFNTASSGTTFSINGRQLTLQSTESASSWEVKGDTGVTNATYAASLVNVINTSTMNLTLIATTDVPVGATMLSSNSVYIYPKVMGGAVLSATGHYGATANKGVLVAGDYVASIGVPAEKIGGRYITIGVNSSGLKTPFAVSLQRSRGRYMPVNLNTGMAQVVNIGSTTT